MKAWGRSVCPVGESDWLAVRTAWGTQPHSPAVSVFENGITEALLIAKYPIY